MTKRKWSDVELTEEELEEREIRRQKGDEKNAEIRVQREITAIKHGFSTPYDYAKSLLQKRAERNGFANSKEYSAALKEKRAQEAGFASSNEYLASKRQKVAKSKGFNDRNELVRICDKIKKHVHEDYLENYPHLESLVNRRKVTLAGKLISEAINMTIPEHGVFEEEVRIQHIKNAIAENIAHVLHQDEDGKWSVFPYQDWPYQDFKRTKRVHEKPVAVLQPLPVPLNNPFNYGYPAFPATYQPTYDYNATATQNVWHQNPVIHYTNNYQVFVQNTYAQYLPELRYNPAVLQNEPPVTLTSLPHVLPDTEPADKEESSVEMSGDSESLEDNQAASPTTKWVDKVTERNALLRAGLHYLDDNHALFSENNKRNWADKVSHPSSTKWEYFK